MASLNRLLIGACGIGVSYNGLCAFLDWMRGAAGTYEVVLTGNVVVSGKAAWDAGYFENQTGDLKAPVPANVVNVRRAFYSQVDAINFMPKAVLDNEAFILTFQGSATVTAGFTGTGGSVTMINPNKYRIVMGVGGTNSYIQFAITNVNDPPVQVSMYQERYATEWAAGEIFNPDWLNENKNFAVLRLPASFQPMNNVTQRNFSEYAGLDYYKWGSSLVDGSYASLPNTGGPSGSGPKGCVPLAAIKNLALKTGKPIHFGIPYMATDDLVTQVATYFRDNVPTPMHYELCNELWNFGFWQTHYTFLAGARVFGKQITAATRGATTTLTVAGHGYTSGNSADFYMNDLQSWSGLHIKSHIVTVLDPNTITIPFDSSALPAFSASDCWTSNDLNRGAKWVGVRLAQCLKIIRDVYADRSRWQGVLAGQAVNPAFASAVISGINYWRANMLVPANSLAVNDLVDAYHITGYFGDVRADNRIVNISKANPAVVTVLNDLPNVGWVTGTKVRMFVPSASAMTALNNTTQTITKLSNTTFSIPVDTTGFPTFVPDNSAHLGQEEVYALIDKSIAKNATLPGTYTDKYQYYAEQLRDCLLTGTCAEGVTTPLPVSVLRSTTYPASKAIADSIGVKLKQYEGGCHFVGGAYTQAMGANFIYNEFLVMTGHRAEMATVYRESYRAFLKCGGIAPAKFVDCGPSSRFGTWPGYRWLPTSGNAGDSDTTNPVWQAVKDWNDNAQPDTWSARFGA